MSYSPSRTIWSPLVSGTLTGVILAAVGIGVGVGISSIQLGTPQFAVGDMIRVAPSGQIGIVVRIDCTARTCQYRVRTADPLQEQWLYPAGLQRSD